MNGLRPLSMVDHIFDNGFEIIDGIDTEILNQVLLSFLLLSGNKDGLQPRPEGCQHQTNDYTPNEFTRKDSHKPVGLECAPGAGQVELSDLTG